MPNRAVGKLHLLQQLARTCLHAHAATARAQRQAPVGQRDLHVPRHDAGSQRQRVRPVTVVDRVCTVAQAIAVHIVSRTSVELVIARTAHQGVVARVGRQDIITRQTREQVVAPVAGDVVRQVVAGTVDVFLPELDRLDGVYRVCVGHVGHLPEGGEIHEARHVTDLAAA